MIKKLVSHLLTICFFVYMILLLYFLFFSDKYGRISGYHGINLELFHEIRRFLGMGGQVFFINIIGNVAAFIPFGFLIPVIYREQRKDKVIIGHFFRGFLFVTFLGGLFSLCVESLQLIFHVGSFDVDDLFLNTIGVVVGYIGYVAAKKLIGVFQLSDRTKGG